MLALTLTVSMSVANVFASATSSNAESAAPTVEAPEDVIYDTENEESIGKSPEFKPKSETSSQARSSRAAEKIDSVLMLGETGALNASNKVTVDLPATGDTKTFNMQVDHTLYPEARLCIFIYDGFGDCTIDVAGVRKVTLRTKAPSTSTGFNVKEVFKINGSGGVTDYAVTVSTTTGNVGCALILAPEDTFAEMCGGEENAASVQKNDSTPYGPTSTGGLQSLLNGNGEWFRYTADGDTYIHASATSIDDFIITVYDADTELLFDQTSARDLETERRSDTYWIGHVSKNFALQPGHDYFIQVQSSSTIVADSSKWYNFSVGLPDTTIEMVDIKSTNTYSIPAYVTKTFKFNVNGYPNSTRLDNNGKITFQTGRGVDNISITSCKFTAPNGKVFIAEGQGLYRVTEPLDYNNYLTNNNTPLNGTWTVTVKANEPISGLKFRIYCQARHIPGSDGNE